MKDLLAKMHSALEEERFEEFKAHAHAIKGSSGIIGAVALAELGSEALRLTTADFSLQGETLFSRFRETFSATRNGLSNYVSSQQLLNRQNTENKSIQ